MTSTIVCFLLDCSKQLCVSLLLKLLLLTIQHLESQYLLEGLSCHLQIPAHYSPSVSQTTIRRPALRVLVAHDLLVSARLAQHRHVPCFQVTLQQQIRAPLDAIRHAFAQTRSCNLHREGSVVAVDALLFQSKLLQSMTTDALTEFRLEATRRNETMGASGDVKRAKRLRQCVVCQDAQFVVLDKPQGLTLQSLDRYLPLLAKVMGSGFCQQAKHIDDDDQQETLRLVDRLDKETSGVLVLVRSRLAATKFSALLRSGAVHKTYEALVARRSSKDQSCSRWTEWEGQEIHDPVDDKTACTLVERVLQRNEGRYTEHSGKTAWLQLRPRTGRKHQLRVHCAQALEAPIVGDTKYGGRRANRLYLHSARIRFLGPFAEGSFVDVKCEMEPRKRPDPCRIQGSNIVDHVGTY
uniref:Pseudouridine synthase RsuA/RluA-like domain-containing protein n=1 Tax=Peronospora matthiolae TaxID=2874970 RepID=A0AAV1VEG8_9STRA